MTFINPPDKITLETIVATAIQIPNIMICEFFKKLPLSIALPLYFLIRPKHNLSEHLYPLRRYIHVILLSTDIVRNSSTKEKTPPPATIVANEGFTFLLRHSPHEFRRGFAEIGLHRY